ncbi:MAG: hypothetical protein AAF650_04910 [Pseudomonadota bacterium]
MQRLGLAGLIKVELPSHTVRLCDGGFLDWNSETFLGRDGVYGVILSLEALAEGVGDEVPALEMELAPPGDVAVGDLSAPGHQNSRARFWIAEYDVETHDVLGTPTLEFDGQVDQTTLRAGPLLRALSVTIVSTAERLLEANSGNGFSDAFHQSVWPGELGHANADGLKIKTAWGVETQGGSGSFRGGGGGGGGGGNPGGRGNSLF